MNRAFPNQLNQKEVIQLANHVVPDFSVTFKEGPHHEQLHHQQYTGGNKPNNFGSGYQPSTIASHYYTPNSYYFYQGYPYQCCRCASHLYN